MRKNIWITVVLAGMLFVSAPALAGPLHDAARSGDAAAVEQLIAGGADVNEKDAGLNTALHWAADNGHLEVVRVLIAKGADIDARDMDNGTPLIRATREKRTEAAGFLIARGAGVNLLTSLGVSALDNAIDFGLTEVTEKLKNAGAKCGTSYAYSLNCQRVEGQK